MCCRCSSCPFCTGSTGPSPLRQRSCDFILETRGGSHTSVSCEATDAHKDNNTFLANPRRFRRLGGSFWDGFWYGLPRGSLYSHEELSRLATDRSFHIYIFRLFLYWDAFSSSLSTSDAQAYPVNTISDTIARPPFSSLVHPITGIATTLCPLIGEAGRYLRWVVDTRTLSAPVSLDLESRLRQWQPPDTSSSQPQLLQLAEGYRNAGLIMLYQAEAVARALSTEEEADLLSRVLYIINILKHIPDQDPMLN